MGGSSKRTTNTNQTQSQQSQFGSTSFATPHLDEYQAAAQRAAQMGGYQGDVVAGPTMADRYVAGATPLQREGLDSSVNWTRGQGATLADTGTQLGDYWNRVASGEFLDPNNPALTAYLDTMSEGVRDEFDRGAQRFNSDAISAGAYGGTGYGQGMAWALDELSQNELAARSSVLYNHYLNEMDRIGQAGNGALQAFGMGSVPGERLMALGEGERNWNQLDINNDLMRREVDQTIRQADLTNDAARFEAAQNGEMGVWERYFQSLANPVFGTSSQGTSQGTSTTTESQPAWQQILGGLSSAAQIAGAFGLGGPAGAAVAAAGGAFKAPTPQYSGAAAGPPMMQLPDFSQYMLQSRQPYSYTPPGIR